MKSKICYILFITIFNPFLIKYFIPFMVGDEISKENACILFVIDCFVLSCAILKSKIKLKVCFAAFLTGLVVLLYKYSLAAICLIGIIYLLLVSAFNSSKIFMKHLFANLLAIVLVFLIGELFFTYKDSLCSYSVSQQYSENDSIIGYKAIAKASAVETFKVGNDVIYKSLYTIDKNSHRVLPDRENGQEILSKVLFFGCSFTFGKGVNDTETLPWKLQELCPDALVQNYAFNGYGPQQMLRLVELNLSNNDKSNIDDIPVVVVYQGLVKHVARAVQLGRWSRYQIPIYEVNNEGDLQFYRISKGVKEDVSGMRQVWNGSRLLSKLLEVSEDWYNDADVDYFCALVDRSYQVLKKKHPNLSFHFILWDEYIDGDRWYKAQDAIVNYYRNNPNIKLHLVSEIIGNPNGSNVRIHPQYDRHPKPWVHKKIAEYLKCEVIE